MTAPLRLSHVSLEVTELHSSSELDTLANEWAELWEACGQTPFQSPMWLIPWARLFTGENLVVLTIRSAGRLIAVIPFYIWREELFLLGNGLSDYLDCTVHDNFKKEVLSSLHDWLNEQQFLREIHLNQLPLNSILLRISPRTFSRRELNGDSCPVLELVGRSQHDFAPAKQLEKLRYYQRRASKQGKLEFERAELVDCQDYLDLLFALHHARWSDSGGGVLGDNRVREFHREAVPRFAKAGALRLYRLKLNSEIIAVLYAFANSNTTFYYLGGFDPKFEKLSPGTLIIGHAIEAAINEAHHGFNFLRGRESYKYAWGATDTQTRSITLSKI